MNTTSTISKDLSRRIGRDITINFVMTQKRLPTIREINALRANSESELEPLLLRSYNIQIESLDVRIALCSIQRELRRKEIESKRLELILSFAQSQSAALQKLNVQLAELKAA
jgi:hypothetical protein